MARVTNPEDYTLKRNEILAAAQGLVYSKGYERMSIQDILDALHISKGAFYHYFDSKQSLLEALVDRMLQEAWPILLPIVDDPSMGALEKLRRLYAVVSRWKTDQKEYLLALFRTWYTDDNAIVRQKVMSAASKTYAQYFARIIRQGIREGVLNNPYPDQAGEAVFALLMGVGESLAESILSGKLTTADLPAVEKSVLAYTDAMERLLGAPQGSLEIIDMDTMREWIELTSVEAPAPGGVVLDR